MRNLLLLLVFLGSAAAVLVGIASEAPTLVFFAKPFPVLALLVWVALGASSATRAVPWVYRAALVALAFSVVGDVILELDKSYFVFGLGAFFVAHVFYVVAFLAPPAARKLSLGVAIPFAAWGIGMSVFIWPGLGFKGMTVPVVLYTVVLTSMMWRAVARADEKPSRAQWACIIGAVLFGLSDSLIALRDFHAPFDWSHYGILVTYWAGQAGLALGFTVDDDETSRS